FDAPRDFDLEAYRRERLFVPGADAVTVRVRLDALAAARVGAAWPAGAAEKLADGGPEIAVQSEGLAWVVGWTLGCGLHAEIPAPPDARAALRAKIQTMLQNT